MGAKRQLKQERNKVVEIDWDTLRESDILGMTIVNPDAQVWETVNPYPEVFVDLNRAGQVVYIEIVGVKSRTEEE